VQIISSQKQLGRLNCIIGDENKNKIVITWQSSNVGPNRNIDFSKTNKPFQIKHSWNILFLGLFEKYLFFVCFYRKCNIGANVGQFLNCSGKMKIFKTKNLTEPN